MFTVFDENEEIHYLRLTPGLDGQVVLHIPRAPSSNLLDFKSNGRLFLYSAINRHLGLRLSDSGRLVTTVISHEDEVVAPVGQNAVRLRLVDSLRNCVFVAAVDERGLRVEGGCLLSLHYDGHFALESSISNQLGLPLSASGRMQIDRNP